MILNVLRDVSAVVATYVGFAELILMVGRLAINSRRENVLVVVQKHTSHAIVRSDIILILAHQGSIMFLLLLSLLEKLLLVRLQ